MFHVCKSPTVPWSQALNNDFAWHKAISGAKGNGIFWRQCISLKTVDFRHNTFFFSRYLSKIMSLVVSPFESNGKFLRIMFMRCHRLCKRAVDDRNCNAKRQNDTRSAVAWDGRSVFGAMNHNFFSVAEQIMWSCDGHCHCFVFDRARNGWVSIEDAAMFVRSAM